MIKRMTLAVLLASVSIPALALEEPVPGKKDPRMLTAAYDPNNPVHIWSAVGAIFVIRFADDEAIKKVKIPDGIDLVGDYLENGSVLIFKFEGCLIPEMAFVFTKKADGQLRTYSFQVETIPRTCNTKIPAPATTVTAPGTGASFIPAAVAAEAATSDPAPNLAHLPHPDALMVGGGIPWMLTMTYPGDEVAKRRAAFRAKEKVREQNETHELLQQNAVPVENQDYWGIGDGNLKPARAWDDYATTKFGFVGMQNVPIVTRLIDPSKTCGVDKQNEAAVDFAVKDGAIDLPSGPVRGSVMTIAGTAQAWCLRSAHFVTELWNGHFTTGRASATGTSVPNIERVIRGGPNDD